MKKTISRLISYLLIPIFLFAALLSDPTSVYAASTKNINPYNALEITVNSTSEDGSVSGGTELWYVFTCPAGNGWLITRLTGVHENGILQVGIYDLHLNLIKENYTQAGNHIAEIVCRMHDEGVGSKQVFIPRLMAGEKYYVRISGSGDFNLNCDWYDDDYRGDFDSATALKTGKTVSGKIERDEDIDSFYFDVPDGNSYKITVKATKKMDVDIADDNEYILDSNNLRVLRDNGTAEYTVSGSGIRRYFFLSGKGGTYYKISVAIDPNAAKLGLWTKVTADVGTNFIKVDTKKGAKISIIVKKGSGRRKIKIRYKRKKKKKITVTQKQATKTYRLTRSLQPGDIVIVTATKKRYKEFNFRKKIR